MRYVPVQSRTAERPPRSPCLLTACHCCYDLLSSPTFSPRLRVSLYARSPFAQDKHSHLHSSPHSHYTHHPFPLLLNHASLEPSQVGRRQGPSPPLEATLARLEQGKEPRGILPPLLHLRSASALDLHRDFGQGRTTQAQVRLPPLYRPERYG
jgi:hypothetical protein